MGNFNESARIAKTLQWSSSIHHLLGVNCVGNWNFNEGTGNTVNDASGNGNNGTLRPSYPSDSPNWVESDVSGNALYFDGVNDYMDVGEAASLNITDTITIELWTKPAFAQEICYPGSGSDGNVGVAAKVEDATGSANWSWQLRYGSSDSCRLGFQFNTVGAGAQWVTAQQDLTPGQWYHIAGIFDGTSINFYLNGELKDTNTLGAPTTIESNLNKLLIASDGWSEFTGYFNGTVDEFRIYNEALPEQAIREHYLAGLEKHQNLVKR